MEMIRKVYDNLYAFLYINTQGHGTFLADFVLSIQGAQVQSLVGEQRSCKPCSIAKKKKKKEKINVCACL